MGNWELSSMHIFGASPVPLLKYQGRASSGAPVLNLHWKAD